MAAHAGVLCRNVLNTADIVRGQRRCCCRRAAGNVDDDTHVEGGCATEEREKNRGKMSAERSPEGARVKEKKTKTKQVFHTRERVRKPQRSKNRRAWGFFWSHGNAVGLLHDLPACRGPEKHSHGGIIEVN